MTHFRLRLIGLDLIRIKDKLFYEIPFFTSFFTSFKIFKWLLNKAYISLGQMWSEFFSSYQRKFRIFLSKLAAVTKIYKKWVIYVLLSPRPLSPEPLSPRPLSPRPLSPEALSPRRLSPEPLSPELLRPMPKWQKKICVTHLLRINVCGFFFLDSRIWLTSFLLICSFQDRSPIHLISVVRQIAADLI